jgi:hypothetical protein
MSRVTLWQLFRHTWHYFSVPVFLLWSLLSTSGLQAESLVPDELRVVKAVSSFNNVSQVAAVYRLRPPPVLSAHYLEFAVGAFTSPEDSRAMISAGPSWQFPLSDGNTVLRLGIAPTLISGSTFDDDDLGGNFHFTSFLGIASQFGKNNGGTIALRIQHTSNAGIENTNPGIDMVGISINYRLGN